MLVNSFMQPEANIWAHCSPDHRQQSHQLSIPWAPPAQTQSGWERTKHQSHQQINHLATALPFLSDGVCPCSSHRPLQASCAPITNSLCIRAPASALTAEVPESKRAPKSSGCVLGHWFKWHIANGAGDPQQSCLSPPPASSEVPLPTTACIPPAQCWLTAETQMSAETKR